MDKSEYNFVFTEELTPEKIETILIPEKLIVEVVGFISRQELPVDEIKECLKKLDQKSGRFLTGLVYHAGCFKGCDISDLGDAWGKIFIYGDDNLPLTDFKLTEPVDEKRPAEISELLKVVHQYQMSNQEKFTKGLVCTRLFVKDHCSWSTMCLKSDNSLKH